MCLGLVGEAATCTLMLLPFNPELSGSCQPSLCHVPQGEAADKLGELCLPKQRPPVATSPQPSGEAHVPMPSPFAAVSSWMDAGTLVGSPPQSSSYEQYKRALHQEWDDVRDEGASEASEEVRDGRDRPPPCLSTPLGHANTAEPIPIPPWAVWLAWWRSSWDSSCRPLDSALHLMTAEALSLPMRWGLLPLE